MLKNEACYLAMSQKVKIMRMSRDVESLKTIDLLSRVELSTQQMKLQNARHDLLRLQFEVEDMAEIGCQ